MQPDPREVKRIIDLSLAEDVGRGDRTSNLTVAEDAVVEFAIRTRQQIVLCGVEIACQVFEKLSSDMDIKKGVKDGDVVNAGYNILSGKGNARAILGGERVALNLLRQLCGVATNTRQFVEKTKGTKAKILDTRKTIPGLRTIQKYAVTVGGGHNHRFCLDDGILIKDNHIAICGSIKEALKRAREGISHPLTRIEIECDTIDQVKEALEHNADLLLLDNMDTDTLKEAVKIVDGKIPLEASGNVTVDKVEEIAKTGVDFISAGMLTNAPLNVDIGLDIDL